MVDSSHVRALKKGGPSTAPGAEFSSAGLKIVFVALVLIRPDQQLVPMQGLDCALEAAAPDRLRSASTRSRGSPTSSWPATWRRGSGSERVVCLLCGIRSRHKLISTAGRLRRWSDRRRKAQLARGLPPQGLVQPLELSLSR